MDAVLFDLDGTILDTNELIIETFLHILKDRTSKPLTREFISANMGLALKDQLRFFTGREDVDDLVPIYREYNIRRHNDLVTAFPHVLEVLAQLKEHGCRIGVVTNKARVTTEMGLRHTGIDAYVDEVLTVDDVRNPKPDPEMIVRMMDKLGTAPERTLMVGDSHYDILAAHRAGVRAVGVAWSLKGTGVLKEHGADWIIEDIRELPKIAGIAAGAGGSL